MARPVLGKTKRPPQVNQVQAKAAPGKGGSVSPRVANSIKSLRGGGTPLPKSSKAFFEPRFGQDFSKVRLHTDAKAADMADSIQAKAFTLGNDIAFAKGAYNPESKSGKQLLAHELTHTVQQDGERTIKRQENTEEEKKPEQSAAIPDSINSVTIEKAGTVNDSNLKSVAIDKLKKVISSTMDGVKVDAIYVSSVNDGTHGDNSRHFSNLAVDISRLKTEGAEAWQYMETTYPSNANVKKVVEALQNGFENEVGTPGVRENFGPFIKKKNGKSWTVGGHSDHIHVSFNE